MQKIIFYVFERGAEHFARTSKSVAVMSKKLTHEEHRARLNTETKLKDKEDKLKPPAHLNNK
jgi:hypothetical protein